MNTVYDLEHEPSIFVYCFRFRGRSAFFLVSIDSCFHQDTQKKFGGAAVSGTGCTTVSVGVMRATCQSAWPQYMSPLYLVIISDSKVVGSALFLMFLDSCAHQDTHKIFLYSCCVWNWVYNCFRGSNWGLMF